MNNTFIPSEYITSDAIKTVKQRYIAVISSLSIFGLAIGIFQLCTTGVSTIEWSLLVFMSSVTGVGITAGFHRHFSHKTFETHPAIRALLAVAGSMAAEGSVVAWASIHRCHHQYTDVQGDPHSPNLHGEGFWHQARGLWHAHIGWLLDNRLPNSSVFAKDLVRDPMIAAINQYYLFWIGLGFLIPALIGGLVTTSWLGVWQGFLWGGLVRLFFSFNGGYVINSIAHVFGRQMFPSTDHSRNNFWLAIPTFGEGWHNNHHAFPGSAKFGFRWWQLDLGYLFIRCLELLGLAWDVKIPNADIVEAKLLEKVLQEP
jgi:stearoyl-CoA desaturase (Delta-9 desaturase)